MLLISPWSLRTYLEREGTQYLSHDHYIADVIYVHLSQQPLTINTRYTFPFRLL